MFEPFPRVPRWLLEDLFLTDGVFTDDTRTAVTGRPNAHLQAVLNTGGGPSWTRTVHLTKEQKQRLTDGDEWQRDIFLVALPLSSRRQWDDVRCDKDKGMPTSENLRAVQQKLAQTPQNEVPQLAAVREANIECAIAISEAVSNLVGGLDKVEVALKAATAQAATSSAESAELSRKLNSLTRAIIIAAFASALAAAIQAVIAVYTTFTM
jgi:hypothetical protein